MYQVIIMCNDLEDSIKVWEAVHTQLRIMDGISKQPRGSVGEPTLSKFRLAGKVTLDVTGNVLRNLSDEQLWKYDKPIQDSIEDGEENYE